MGREYGKMLSGCTSLRIGGPVFCWVEAEDVDAVLEALGLAEEARKPVVVLGRGSNVLAQASGFDGVVVRLGKGFDSVEVEGTGVVKVGAAVAISRLVNESARAGFSGCEFLAGIPGSFGGAIFMNAGVRDIKNPEKYNEVKDIIIDVDVLDLKTRKTQNIKRREIDFKYRSSGMDSKCVLGARIRLKKDKGEAIEKKINAYMEKRKWMRATGMLTAGSVFKNPDSARPAGKLIEECGLKGRAIGGARISGEHANFIVNTGSASSDDVMELVELARKNVRQRFGIDLELELKVL
ncbi:MAG: UDP-N-acetylmuramate dehydrogenase [Candidatus Omnitrophica bacterium]|nr:UDP-N-acetylmuramate dehydrogenase [Candidatus Omnitrophota bacterium]